MNLVSIVLAAGAATRFGSNKLCAPFGAQPLLHHAIRAARAAPVSRVIVVCPPGLAVGDWPGAPPVMAERLRSDALSASLKAGVAAAGASDGAFVFLGDMPLTPHDIAPRLAAVLGEGFAAMPRHGGRPGHPVLLSRRAFAAIADLGGDEGAGRLLRQRADVVVVDVDNDAVLLDVDRPADLQRLSARR